MSTTCIGSMGLLNLDSSIKEFLYFDSDNVLGVRLLRENNWVDKSISIVLLFFI